MVRATVKAAVVMAAALVTAGPAGALTVTLNPGSNVSDVELIATGSAISTLFPAAIPFVDSDTNGAGATTVSATYDFTDGGFTITFDLSADTDATARSRGTSIFFSVDQDVDFVLSGSLFTVSPGTQVKLSANLTDFTAGLTVATSIQESRSTPNESFVLGESGGDFQNINFSGLSGTLIAGREYGFLYEALIDTRFGSIAGPASGSGSVTLAFVPEASTALLLAGGLAALGLRRRSS